MLDNSAISVVIIVVILYFVSNYFKTFENFEQTNVPNFNLMSAVNTTYASSDLSPLVLNKIDSDNNYTATNGSLTKIVTDLTIDFKSFNDKNLSYYTILYNNTQNDLTLTCKIPKYDESSYQSNNIVIKSTSDNVTTLKKGKFYLIYFLPINGLNQVSTIDSNNFDNLNGKIFNSNVSINYDAANFRSQFNTIIFYSSSFDGKMTTKSGNEYTLNKNTFYLIKNTNINDKWTNHVAPIKINQFNISEIN